MLACPLHDGWGLLGSVKTIEECFKIAIGQMGSPSSWGFGRWDGLSQRNGLNIILWLEHWWWFIRVAVLMLTNDSGGDSDRMAMSEAAQLKWEAMGGGLSGPGQICGLEPVILFKWFFILKNYFLIIFKFYKYHVISHRQNLNGHHPVDLIFPI